MKTDARKYVKLKRLVAYVKLLVALANMFTEIRLYFLSDVSLKQILKQILLLP